MTASGDAQYQTQKDKSVKTNKKELIPFHAKQALAGKPLRTRSGTIKITAFGQNLGEHRMYPYWARGHYVNNPNRVFRSDYTEKGKFFEGITTPSSRDLFMAEEGKPEQPEPPPSASEADVLKAVHTWGRQRGRGIKERCLVRNFVRWYYSQPAPGNES